MSSVATDLAKCEADLAKAGGWSVMSIIGVIALIILIILGKVMLYACCSGSKWFCFGTA